MHVGIFSSIVGTTGGPAIVDKRLLEAIAARDRENRYTVYRIREEATQGLELGERGGFTFRTIRPSGKWLAVSVGVTLELLKRPVDLLHATFVAPPFVPGKFVITMTCWSQFMQPEFYPPPVRWRLQFLLSRALKKATGVFCYTEYLREKVIEEFRIDPERVFLTEPGVSGENVPIEDEEILQSVLGDIGIEKGYLYFIGQVTRRKNIIGLLRAYNILYREAKIENKLLILGENSFYHEEIHEEARNLGLTDQVVFEGRHAYADLPALYSAASVLVFPTLSEGFGLPPLEAMACGTPVVASNATCVPEVVGDAALLVDPHNPEEMAQAIHNLLKNEELRKSMIEKGFARSRRFTWDRMAEQVLAAYGKIHEMDGG